MSKIVQLTMNGEKQSYLHFILPSVGAENGSVKLNWNILDPALTLFLHRSEYNSSTTFYVTIRASHGLWGTRHQWLRGLLNVIEAQQSDNELADEWLRDASFMDEVEYEYTRLRRFELESLQLDEARKQIWSVARDVQERFAGFSKSTHVTPSFMNPTIRPYDVQVYVPLELPDAPVSMSEEQWNSHVWHETFHWSEDETLTNRSIRYWSRHPDESAFEHMLITPEMGWKGTWPALIETITKRPETPAMIERLLGWVANPNWPGAGIAWNHLVGVIGKRALPHIDEFIQSAKDCGDDWWEEILKSLKEAILEKEYH